MSGTTVHKRVARPHLIVTNGQLTALCDTAAIPAVAPPLGLCAWIPTLADIIVKSIDIRLRSR